MDIKFNSGDFEKQLKAEAIKAIEDEMSERIRNMFPEVTDFSVSYNIDTEKITLNGLSEGQIAEILNN